MAGQVRAEAEYSGQRGLSVQKPRGERAHLGGQ